MVESMNTQEEKIAKKFTPETMKHIVYVTWPTISDKGDQIAWVDWKGDMQSGLFSSKIHLMNLNKEDALQGNNDIKKNTEILLTSEGVNEKQPKLLSDGIHMMYLSDESGEFQVHIRNLQTKHVRSQLFATEYFAISCLTMRESLSLRQPCGRMRSKMRQP